MALQKPIDAMLHISSDGRSVRVRVSVLWYVTAVKRLNACR